MNIDVKYGSEILDFQTADNTHILDTKLPEDTVDKDNFRESLKRILHNKPRDYSDTAIIISDKTRLCGYELYLPWLLEILNEEGVRNENITFYIAYGTHPKQSDTESMKSYGETYNTYKFVHHYSNDEAVFANLGVTSRGTRIKVRRDVLNATCIFTFGAISHHYFAGYGGGRKLLFPGLAAKASIYQNHSLFLNFDKNKLQEGCKPGQLTGNPLAEDLKEIDDQLPEKISIHGILNNKGKVCQLHVGENYNDFIKACSIHDLYYKSGLSESFDMVIASPGGYPKDINFIQSHKSVHHAAAFVKDGGILLLFAECRDGIGNDSFLPLFMKGGSDAVYRDLKINYEGNGGTALAMMEKTARIRIGMVTSLDMETCNLIGVKKNTPEEAKNLILGHTGSVAFIPNASMLVK